MLITLASVLSSKQIKTEKCTFYSIELVTSQGFIFKVTSFDAFAEHDVVSVLLDTDTYGQAKIRIVPKIQL